MAGYNIVVQLTKLKKTQVPASTKSQQAKNIKNRISTSTQVLDKNLYIQKEHFNTYRLVIALMYSPQICVKTVFVNVETLVPSEIQLLENSQDL